MQIINSPIALVRVSSDLWYNPYKIFGNKNTYYNRDSKSAVEIIKQIPRRTKSNTQ